LNADDKQSKRREELKDLKEMSWQELDELRKDLESKLGEDLSGDNNGDNGNNGNEGGDQLNPPEHWLEDELVEALGSVVNLGEAKRPGPKKGAPKSPPKGYPTSRDQYADPENYKYPLDTYDHTRAAIGYFSQADNRSAYSPEEQKFMWRRIIAAAKRDGIELSDDVKKHAEKLGEPDSEVSDMEEKKLAELVDSKIADALKKVKEQGEAYALQTRVHPDVQAVRDEMEAFKAKHAEMKKKLGELDATYQLSAMREDLKNLKAAVAKLAPPAGDQNGDKGNGNGDGDKDQEKKKEQGKPPEKVKEQAAPVGAPLAQGAVATADMVGKKEGVAPPSFGTEVQPPRSFAEAMERASRRRK
jgi:vacuolar-type H+-ATPase subunit I/STV1